MKYLRKDADLPDLPYPPDLPGREQRKGLAA